jgi:hypothetical protein
MDHLSIPERLAPIEPAENVRSNDASTGDRNRRRHTRSSSPPATAEEVDDLPGDENTHEIDELA